jgi:tRNA G18 (ribose-2'-O)-methylase SpoU
MLVAIELSNPENVGGLIRVAGSADCERVIFTGDEKNFKRSKIKSTATSGYNNVNWEFCSEQGWPDKIPDGYTIIGVETCPDATNIYETELPSDKVAFVVGNESFGISEWSLERCNQIVYMPMPGIVKSLNVSQAATLAMFEWWRRVYSEQ